MKHWLFEKVFFAETKIFKTKLVLLGAFAENGKRPKKILAYDKTLNANSVATFKAK